MDPVKPVRNWGGSAPVVPEPKPQCKGSSIQPHKEILVSDVPHAGLLSHICSREEHEDTTCLCKRGTAFVKPFKMVRP
jgi:hypothetical protein